MPTDGADFTRRRAAYGDVFVKIKNGSSESEIADSVGRGLRRDILTDGEAQIFAPLVALITEFSKPQLFNDAEKRAQLASSINRLEEQFADASLSRHFSAAARCFGLAAIDEHLSYSPEEAGAGILLGFRAALV